MIHFNPRPPWGGRPRRACDRLPCQYFNPRPPWGGRRFPLQSCCRLKVFQSTPSVGRATPSVRRSLRRKEISIHALRGEGDVFCLYIDIKLYHFNPRPPWGGRPSSSCKKDTASLNFNPRPPWGGRPSFLLTSKPDTSFQSTPSVGRATSRTRIRQCVETFQSTPSVGRATDKATTGIIIERISIHALRGEGDDIPESGVGKRTNFNPRPPWGGRLQPRQPGTLVLHFNPRPPWGGRPSAFSRQSVLSAFQSTPSVGRATSPDQNQTADA